MKIHKATKAMREEMRKMVSNSTVQQAVNLVSKLEIFQVKVKNNRAERK